MRRIVMTVILLVAISMMTFITFIVLANINNIIFAIRRPDYIDAARRVEQEEQKRIEEEINKVKKESLKRILSPLVINETK